MLLAVSVQTINAREIMGLNFCGTVSVADVNKSIEKNNATISEENTDSDTGVISISTKDYKLADTVKNITFSIYKNKLYEINIRDSSVIDDILDAKYGLLRRELKSEAGIDRQIFYYNIKDKDVDLFLSYSKFPRSLGLSARTYSSITYSCKSIERVVKAEFNKIKNKQQLQKSGANKL